MKLIHTYCIGRAHELIVSEIYNKGYERITTKGEKTLEIDGSCIVIDNPFTEPMVSDKAAFGRMFAEQYADQILHGTKADFDYTYHDLLFNYEYGDSDFYDYVIEHFNQVAYVIDELKQRPTSRQAVMSLWNPPVHFDMENCPCLNHVQCVIIDGKLCMNVTFRSNDMCAAFGQNAFGLVHLQKYIADALGLPVGRYQHISLIPHIYIIRDKNDIERLIGVD
jgi:thymidylate synthase